MAVYTVELNVPDHCVDLGKRILSDILEKAGVIGAVVGIKDADTHREENKTPVVKIRSAEKLGLTGDGE